MDERIVKARLACQIAQVNQLRFGEAATARFYPCAPATISGKQRWFGMNDLLALCVYGALVAEGEWPRFAGPVACDFLDWIEANPDAEAALQVLYSNGDSAWAADSAEALIRHPGRDIYSHRVWDIDSFRQRAIQMMDAAGVKHPTA